jgi:phage gp36-like protein
MSDFITKTDYESHIREHRLDQMTDFEDADLDTIEKRAIGVVKSHLNGRFDVDSIFAETGADRDPVVLGCSIDITLYFLWRKANPRKVPDFIKEAYDDAIEWLTGVKDGTIIPVGLPFPTDGTKSTILYGSNPKRVNHLI